MKKILIVSNALLLCISLLLGFLLLNANDQLRQVKAQSISTPIPIAPADRPSATLTPAPEILNTPEATDNLFKRVDPLGSLPLSPAQRIYSTSMPVPDLEKNNPIDDFFDLYWPLALSTMEENHMWGDYMDAWKAEVLHAYELLAQLANPNAEYLLEELEEASLCFDTPYKQQATPLPSFWT